jgi:hypothetical protein
MASRSNAGNPSANTVGIKSERSEPSDQRKQSSKSAVTGTASLILFPRSAFMVWMKR